MNTQIALMLAQDGVVTGAVYALMALALVLVFSVTRVILIPQGEFVTYAALSMAAIQAGAQPSIVWLLVALALLVLLAEGWRHWRGEQVDWRSTLAWAVLLPALAVVLALLVQPQNIWGQMFMAIVLVTPMGPLIYRLVFRPLAHASVLFLLIVSVALHWVMVGLGLYFFGAEGSRTTPLWDAHWTLGGIPVSGQSVVVVGAAAVLLVAMALFFGRTLLGKALRATAINRVGARLMGMPTGVAGDICFALAAFIGAISGLLIGPITTIYYDTGFLIGLKGFVAGIVGALASYPMAVVGALVVGQLEAFSSFWASPFKEVIVFSLIIPVLWWRSFKTQHVEEEEDE